MALRRTLGVFCLVALLAPPASSSAQTAADAAGSIVGTVRDGTGAVLPDVAVTAAGGALMAARTTRTSAEGRYRIAALPPGEYTLTFALDGFTTLEHHAIHVGLGFTATLDAALAVAARPETVSVRAPGRLLDRHATGLTETFDAAQLANLPGSRSIFSLLSTTAAVEVGNVEVGGGSGAAGRPYGAYGTRGGNRPMVEGISATGIFPTGFTLDFGSFEEVSVLTGAHGAEWATPGVHMQIISKSGGNQYRGTVYADYENRRWQSFNVDADQVRRGAPGGPALAPRDANRLWRYHDVNADIGGFIVKDRLWWYGSARDQEVASRLLNYPVRPYRTALNNAGGKTTYRLTPDSTVIAFGQTGSNHQPNGLNPFGPVGGSLMSATAINESDASTADQRARGWIWKGEWNTVIDDRLLIEFRAGQFGADQAWTPKSDLPRFEDLVTLKVRGGNRDWRATLRRNQMFGTLSYFREDGIGSHHLKLGAELSRGVETETWEAAYPGNVLHVTRDGHPAEVYFFQTPSKSESGLWSYAAYVSDSVQVADRLTLNLGLRFDRHRVFLPAQEHPAGSPAARKFEAVRNVIAWNLIVPRLGVVYDLTGHGKTLAKVSAGRYRLPPGIAFGFSVNPNASVWWERFPWTDADGSGVWNPGEQGPRPLASRGGVAAESVDSGLELPVVNEFAAWLERELPAGIRIRAGAVRRADRHNYARQSETRPFEAFTVPVLLRDPGPDGLTGTADDGPVVQAYDLRPEYFELRTVNVVGNVPGAGSQFWTAEIAAERRLQGRWSLGASFAHTWHRDQAAAYSGQAVRNNTFPLTPNDAINTGTGGRHVFTTWTAKAHGTLEAPWGIRVTPVLRHQSGQPFGRTFVTTALRYGIVRVLAEPVGSRRMDHIAIVDVRVEKAIRIHRHRRAAAFLDVFNMLNTNPELNAVWTSGPSFLAPVTIVPPRVARIGLRLEW